MTLETVQSCCYFGQLFDFIEKYANLFFLIEILLAVIANINDPRRLVTVSFTCDVLSVAPFMVRNINSVDDLSMRVLRGKLLLYRLRSTLKGSSLPE